MNTQEKYLAGYVIECLTGIKGENQEWVYQVIENGDFRMSDPFLQTVYDIAKTDPRDEKVKEVVAGLVFGYTLVTNKLICEAMEETINNLVQKKSVVHEDKPEYKNISMTYSTDGDSATSVFWYKLNPVGTVVTPVEELDSMIEKFKNRFPSANVVKAN